MSKHSCGVSGFDAWKGDVCDGCTAEKIVTASATVHDQPPGGIVIPKTLEEFRELMARVAAVRVSRTGHSAYAQQLAGTSDAQRHAQFAQQLAGDQYTTTLSRADAAALRALSTATHEQILGIVGEVVRDNSGMFYSTPRGEDKTL